MSGTRVISAILVLALALAGTATLLGLLNLNGVPVAHADPVSRYVALTGNDGGNDCTNDSSPCRTIQHAVDVAATDDVILVATGVYTDMHVRLVPPGYRYPPASGTITQVVYVSKTVAIRGGYTTAFTDPPAPEANPTTLDAQGKGRGMVIAGAVSPTVEGLRFTGGYATGLGGSTWENSIVGGGGAVYIISATASFSNNLVFDNASHDGSGLFLYGSAATLSNNTISSNTAVYFGGGVFLYESAATLDGNTINANTTTDPSISSGGGMYVFKGAVTLIGNTVYSNTVESNGGGIILNTAPNSTLVGNTIMSNIAGSTGRGGGLWMRYCDGTVLSGNTFVANATGSRGGGLYGDGGHVTLVENRIVSNTADLGGGMWFAGRAVTLTGNTILSNTAEVGGGVCLEYNKAMLDGNTISFNRATLEDGEGGGLFLYESDARLNGNIITFNSADRGGGLGLYRSSPALTNTVIADNIAGKSGAGLNIRLRSLARLWHTTIARNHGGDGSGVYIDFMGESGAGGIVSNVAMTNTILVSHTVGITVATGSTATLAATLWHSNTHDWGDTGTILTGALNYRGDPLFAADGYHLLDGSAAIDKGVDAGVTSDIDGDARPCGQGYDLGADEIYCACAVALGGVSVSGPASGYTGTLTLYTFTAVVTPSNTTPPITYTWQATEQSPVVTTTDAINHGVAFAWTTPGTKTITVTARNCGNSDTATHTISIKAGVQYKLYLPLVLRQL